MISEFMLFLFSIATQYLYDELCLDWINDV